MKFILAFILILLTNCPAPSAIHATVNAKVTTYSVISPTKKGGSAGKSILKICKDLAASNFIYGFTDLTNLTD
jgi:hypothetical protein